MIYDNFTGLSYGSAQRVVKKRLHFHPYKVSVVQELLPIDYGKRLHYCQWFNDNIRDDNILDKSFFSDEGWFHLSGYVNSQNYRIWSAENPNVIHETQLHPMKVGVWLAMSRQRIIGPIFFEETITGQRYREILELFVGELQQNEIEEGYFQNDNATAHTARETREYLRQVYDNRVIGAGIWPPRSPDLTPLDFFMFGFLKNKIYINRMHSVIELRNAIINAVQSITPEQLRNVFEGMKKRIDACVNSGGGHFEHNL